MSIYKFPASSRAEALTVCEQIDKIEEEVLEAAKALATEHSDERVIEELWDVIHAAESALRKFKQKDVQDGALLVVVKNNRRGDYSVEAIRSEDWHVTDTVL